MDQGVILYDRDCGLCVWSAERLRAWDGRRRRLRFVPLGSPEADGLLGGMDTATRFGSWHASIGDRVFSAGAAVAPVLDLLPGGGPLARVAERFPYTVEVLYRLVAKRRAAIGAMLGRQACAVDPSRPRSA
ncbi:MAG: DCC1-like thiol-disulfide oxidoreductase family protein [Actinomycetota bacterium]